MSNPYRSVHARQRQRTSGGMSWVLPLLAAGLATYKAKPVLLAFLEAGVIPVGIQGISMRLGALVAGAMALHTYTDLVRGSDRAVLDPHPVQPRQLLTAIAIRTARQRLYLPAMGAIFLLPVALDGYWLAWALGSAVVLGAWVCALGVGFAVHLGGVWAAMSPELAGVMNLVRGNNPRMQAALIYAPGVALAVVGVAVGMASSGAAGVLSGWTPGYFFLAIPPVVGLLGWLAARPLADAWYVRATALLSEIDAQWADLEGAEEAKRVYLDWLAQGRPELLRALRQGWRRLRTWPTGAWLLGFACAFAGWSDAADAPAQALAITAAGALLIAGLPVRMAEGDPEWLDRALSISPVRVAAARGVTAFLYAQGVIVLPAAALLIRQGPDGAAVMLLAELAAAIGAMLAAVAAMRLRGRGAWVYGPVAVLLWSVISGGAG
ncbi:MAG: hypothetical protein ACI8RZ_007000 [Myxococcota bacterium]|jgi:hypothetical protein